MLQVQGVYINDCQYDKFNINVGCRHHAGLNMLKGSSKRSMNFPQSPPISPRYIHYRLSIFLPDFQYVAISMNPGGKAIQGFTMASQATSHHKIMIDILALSCTVMVFKESQDSIILNFISGRDPTLIKVLLLFNYWVIIVINILVLMYTPVLFQD